MMSQEMERKFTRMSELLVVDLQLRDTLVTELDIKNKFISAMLRVQSLKHSSSNAVGSVMDGIVRPKRSLRNKQCEEKSEKVGLKYVFIIM